MPLMIGPRALGDQVDDPGNFVSSAHGNLSQDDTVAAIVLQGRHDFRDALRGCVNLVDEHKRRDLRFVQEAKIRSGQNGCVHLSRDA